MSFLKETSKRNLSRIWEFGHWVDSELLMKAHCLDSRASAYIHRKGQYKSLNLCFLGGWQSQPWLSWICPKERVDTYFFYDSLWTFLRKKRDGSHTILSMGSRLGLHATSAFLQTSLAGEVLPFPTLELSSELEGKQYSKRGRRQHPCLRLNNNSLIATVNIMWSGGRTLSYNSPNNSTGKSSEQNWELQIQAVQHTYSEKKAVQCTDDVKERSSNMVKQLWTLVESQNTSRKMGYSKGNISIIGMFA